MSELIDDRVALDMTHVGRGRFAFYAKRFSPRKASIRLRVLEPLAALREAGLGVARYPLLRRPIGCDVVVISKAFGRGAMKVAKAAAAGVYDRTGPYMASVHMYTSVRSEAQQARHQLTPAPNAVEHGWNNS